MAGHGHGIAIGSEVSGGVSDVHVTNIVQHGPSKYGVHIKTGKARGGYIRDVFITNVSLGLIYHGAALTISASSGNEEPTISKSRWTKISGVHFKDIRRTEPGLATHGGAVEFDCFPHIPCSDITFEDIELSPLGNWRCFSVFAKERGGRNSAMEACLQKPAYVRVLAALLLVAVLAPALIFPLRALAPGLMGAPRDTRYYLEGRRAYTQADFDSSCVLSDRLLESEMSTRRASSEDLEAEPPS